MMGTRDTRARRRSASAAGIGLLLSIAASVGLAAEAPPRGPAQVAQAAAGAGPQSPGRPGPAAHVEARIADLHKKLAITPDQEAAFDSFADVMRANAQAMEAMFHDRAQHRDTTAPGILHWYAELTTAHADGLNKLAPAFDALYAGLSDPQKKAADAAFTPLRQDRPPRRQTGGRPQ